MKFEWKKVEMWTWNQQLRTHKNYFNHLLIFMAINLNSNQYNLKIEFIS